MKKVLAVFGVILGIALLGGFGYVFFVMDESDPATMFVNNPETTQTVEKSKLNVKKKAETPAEIQEALDYETSVNQDTVAWIDIPGTDINNSVLQSYDNSYYLRRNERRQEEVYGCYFADYECSIGSREELTPNVVIYGHSDLKDNPNGPRFSQLFKFTDPEFAKNTPVIHLSTLKEFLNWEIFAVLYTDLDFRFIDAYPEQGVDQMAAVAMEKSLYDYGVTVGPEDNVLVLSTCTIKYGANDTNHRYVIMARLLPEDAEVPTTANIKVKTPAE